MIEYLLLVFTMGASVASEKANPELVPHCGVACIYGACQLSAIDATVDEIESRIRSLLPQVDSSQLSIRDIRTIAESFGLHSAALKTSPFAIRHVPKGSIIYVRPGNGESSTEGVGHFVLLCSATDHFVELLDLTLVEPDIRLRADEFAEIWDGEFVQLSSTPLTAFNASLFGHGALVALGTLLVLGVSAWLTYFRRVNWLASAPLLCLTMAIGCSKVPDMPLSIDRSVFSAGTVTEGEEVLGKFRITAWDRSPVTIAGVRKSCECLDFGTELVGMTLPAGSTYDLLLGVPTTQHVGEVEGVAEISTQPASESPLVVRVRATVLGAPRLISTSSILIRNVLFQEDDQFELVFEMARGAEDAKLELNQPLSDLGGCSIVSVQSQTDTYQAFGAQKDAAVRDLVRVTVQSPRNLGCDVHHRTLSIHWNNHPDRIDIPLEFRVVHPLQLELTELYLPNLQREETRCISIPFKRENVAKDYRITAQCTSSLVKPTLNVVENRLVVDVVAPKEAGTHYAQIDLTGDCGKSSIPALEVPLTIVVR